MGVEGLHFKLFLEGVDVPFLGFDAHFSYKTHFNVEIPPVDEVNDIQPGTYGIVAFKKGAADEWHLLCEGFFVGVQYSKRGSHRTLSLQFRDAQFFLENTLLASIFPEGSANPFALKQARFLGDTSNILQKTSLRVKILNEMLGTGGNAVSSVYEKITSHLEESNDFAKEHAKGWSLNNERFLAVHNPRVSTFAKGELLNNAKQRLERLLGDFDNLMDLMLVVADFIQYDIMPVPCMAQNLTSFVIKPNLALSVPPACNVVFPDECVNFSFSVNYPSRVSRLYLTGEIDGQDLSIFISPAEVDCKENEVIVTDEEKIKGLTPSVRRIPFSLTGLTSPDEEFSSSLADFMYFEEKYRTSPMSITTTFKPDILPGFPMLVLDRIMPMVGYVTSVTHGFDPAAPSAFTAVTLTHVRSVKIDMPFLSKWFDPDVFRHDKLNGSIFSKLGTRVFSDEIEDVGDSLYNLEEAVKTIQEEFHLYRLGKEELAHFKSLFERKLPVLFDERTGSGDIVNSLGMVYNGEEGLVSNGGASPLNINLSTELGNVSELRRAAIEKLKQTLSNGIWSRIIVKDEV